MATPTTTALERPWPGRPWYDFSLGQLFTIGRGGSHDGRDIQTPIGTPLTSLLGGVVTPHTGFYPWGGEVDIQTPYGVTETFAHLDALAVKPGQTIQPGTFIGLSGGENLPRQYSTGPHTHYSLFGGRPWDNSKTFDPTGLLDFVGEGGQIPDIPDPIKGGLAGTSFLSGAQAATGQNNLTTAQTVGQVFSRDTLWTAGLVILGGLLILAGIIVFILPTPKQAGQAAQVVGAVA